MKLKECYGKWRHCEGNCKSCNIKYLIIRRLTTRLEDGRVYVLNERKMRCGDYADNKVLFDVIQKLAEYEELEERGLLKRLPCKIGDTVYKLMEEVDEKGEIKKYYVENAEFELGMFEAFGKTISTNRTAIECKCAVMNHTLLQTFIS